jgi:hypothetical protein
MLGSPLELAVMKFVFRFIVVGIAEMLVHTGSPTGTTKH